MNEHITVDGGCHCGAVRFAATIERRREAQTCNCSICRMSGFQHLIVPASSFRLLSSEDQLSEYRFRSKVARHLFCRTCGIKSFYIPRSNPEGISLNVRCLKLPEGVEIEFQAFDGQNWSQNAAALSHLSEEKS